MITLKDLLTVYWGQVALVLVGLGYLIQRILNLKARKLEINHNLFQEKRLEAVNEFFSSYAKAEQMWIALSIYDVINRNLKAKEIDSIVFPHINELQKDVLLLQIYFDDEDHKLFKQILSNITKVNHTLMHIYFDTNSEMNTVLKSNLFTSTRDKMLNQNEKLFSQLSKVIKESFN